MTEPCKCEIYCQDVEGCRYSEDMVILGDFSKLEKSDSEFEKILKEKFWYLLDG
jgi:hypothetical protein